MACTLTFFFCNSKYPPCSYHVLHCQLPEPQWSQFPGTVCFHQFVFFSFFIFFGCNFHRIVFVCCHVALFFSHSNPTSTKHTHTNFHIYVLLSVIYPFENMHPPFVCALQRISLLLLLPMLGTTWKEWNCCTHPDTFQPWNPTPQIDIQTCHGEPHRNVHRSKRGPGAWKM